jgi:hypothetical protein
VQKSPPKRKGRGRPPIKGKRLKKLSAVLNDPKLSWQRHRISLWYGRTNRLVEIASGTAIWYRAGTRTRCLFALRGSDLRVTCYPSS